MTEVDRLKIIVVTDNYYDALRPDPPCGVRYRTAPGLSVHAEHGLAYYVETVVNGNVAGFIFDYGLDPRGLMNNMAILGIDFTKVSAFGLSHGHFDHWSGLIELLKANQSTIAKETPLYVGEEAFARRLSQPPGSTGLRDLGHLAKDEIEKLGIVGVVEITESIEAVPGAYLTGYIERIVDYETDNPRLFIERGGEIEIDDFRGEQALFFMVKGKGLVVLSGCAHTGIINTVKQTQKLTGIEKVHAILGGFHLINAGPERIEQVIGAMRGFGPKYVIPTHCTGFEAMVSLSRQMPKQFILNTAGTTYNF